MGRAPCCDKTKVKRGPWSPEEDTILKNYIQQNGTGGNWIALPRKAGLNRCGKSCRLRWLNYLRPDIRHGNFTADEDYIICSLYNNIGSRWSVIALNLPGRTDNDVKNYWNTKLKKKLLLSSNSNPSNGRDIFATTAAAAATNNTAIPSTSFQSNLAPIQLKSQVLDHKDPNLDQFPTTPLHMNHNYYYDQGSAQENVNLDQMSRRGEYISTNNCSGSWCTASVSQVSSNAGSSSGSASSSSMGTILSDEINDYNGISATTTWDDYDNGQKRVVLNEVSEGVDAYWMELFLSSSLPDQFYSHDDVVSAGYDLQGKMSEVASIPDGSSDNLFVSQLV